MAQSGGAPEPAVQQRATRAAAARLGPAMRMDGMRLATTLTPMLPAAAVRQAAAARVGQAPRAVAARVPRTRRAVEVGAAQGSRAVVACREAPEPQTLDRTTGAGERRRARPTYAATWAGFAAGAMDAPANPTPTGMPAMRRTSMPARTARHRAMAEILPVMGERAGSDLHRRL